MVTIFDHLDKDQAYTFSLVLNSSGIGNRVMGSGGLFRIDVPEDHGDAAREAIFRYQRENPETGDDIPVQDSVQTRKNLSGIAVALLLLSVHLAVSTSAVPEDYITVFGANAHRILGGEVYRCATALVLHADAAHIAGNMAGMALFGGAVCSVAGTGIGWLMIVASGVFGNWINAIAYGAGHLSIGASTAVFGAVGILSAVQAVNAVRTGEGWKRVFLIIGGGIALLAFLGTSARSDMGAHLFGFLAGGVMGVPYRLWMRRPVGVNGQALSGTLVSATLIGAWIWGMMT